MEKIKYNARINYYMLPGHPDIPYYPKWQEGKIESFNDTYTFDRNYFETENDMILYIKHDLALVAGGGYNTNYINIIDYDIQRI